MSLPKILLSLPPKSLAAAALLTALAALPARAADTVPPVAPQAGPKPAPGAAISTAAPGPAGHWSVISGETNAPGHDVLSAELGFPGVSFGYSHGVNERLDAGLKLDLLYGVNYTTQTQFGMQARFPVRIMAARHERISLQLHVDPTLYVYVGGKTTNSEFGLGAPVGAAIGISVLPELRVALGFDLPVLINVAHDANFWIGPQFGFGAEYYVDRNLSVGLNVRVGPMFVPTAGGDAAIGFLTQVVLGWRI